MAVDLIDFDGIRRILSIEASISDIITNHSISLVLEYTLYRNGKFHKQQYLLAGKPEDVYEILNQLRRRNLVTQERFKELKSQVQGLEGKLHSSPAYRYMS